MTLEDLRSFAAVCEALSLSAVARARGLTQPAVSQHVSRLENELGVTLLERHARGVVPTAAGRLLYEGARDALAALTVSERRIAELRDGAAGSLTIATGGTTVRHVMATAVARFRASHPDVQLEFHPANTTARCLEPMRGGGADLAFVTLGPESEGLDVRTVAELRYLLLVPADHPLSRRRRLRPADLRGLPCIGIPEQATSARLLSQELADAGVTLSVRTTVDDWDTAHMLVELGLGVAIVPNLHARSFARSRRVRALPIDGLSGVRVGWAARRWNAVPPSAWDFMDLVDAELAKVRDVPGFRALGRPLSGSRRG